MSNLEKAEGLMERVRKAKLDNPQGCTFARLTPGIHFEMNEAERKGLFAECVTFFRGQKPGHSRFDLLSCNQQRHALFAPSRGVRLAIVHAISNATYSLHLSKASD